MHNFKDRDGNEWSLRMTCGVRDRVLAAEPGADLYDPLSGRPCVFQRLHTDYYFLGVVLLECCRGQVEERGLTGTQFAEIFDGACAKAAQAALLAEYTDFFQQMGRPEIVAALTEMTAQAAAAAGEMAKLVRLKAAELARTIADGSLIASAMSGSGPASPDSIPAG